LLNIKKNSDFSVINHDYITPKSFVKETQGGVFYFSRKNKVQGCYVKDKKIILDIKSKSETLIGETSKLLLRGEHNWENITAAVLAAHLAGAKIEAIKKVVFSFKGLEHRLELVKEVNGVTFYDDSFSTNPQPTLAAVASFTEPLTLILGGSDKGLDYQEMAEKIAKTDNVKNIVLIGDIGPKIGDELKRSKFKGVLKKLSRTSMQEIVETTYELAGPFGVVLLSPASASFGMFRDYKDRGDQFKKTVRNLTVGV